MTTKNKKGMLIIISGPSGCGKGTVVEQLLRRNPNFFLSVSATTREPREGEEDGVHYHFLSRDCFEKLLEVDGMLEYAEYCGNFYGTLRETVVKRCKEGKDVILEIEVQGALQVMEEYPGAISIFILPPSLDELKKRLTGRQTENPQAIRNRLAKAKQEMNFAGQYDYIVTNEYVPETVAQIESIITAEKLSAKRQRFLIGSLLS